MLPLIPLVGAAATAGGFGLSLAQMLGGGGGGGGGIDISGELANIRALYDEQRAIARSTAKEELGQTNRLSASNLAGRGIYSSPVSEYTYQNNSAESQRNLARMLSGIAGDEANTRASMLSTLLGYKRQDQMRSLQAKNQLISMLTGVGGSLMNSKGGPTLDFGGGGSKAPATPRSIPYNIPGNKPNFIPQWIE